MILRNSCTLLLRVFRERGALPESLVDDWFSNLEATPLMRAILCPLRLWRTKQSA